MKDWCSHFHHDIRNLNCTYHCHKNEPKIYFMTNIHHICIKSVLYMEWSGYTLHTQVKAKRILYRVIAVVHTRWINWAGRYDMTLTRSVLFLLCSSSVPPPFRSVPELLHAPSSAYISEIMDGFWCSRCLNDRIKVPNMMILFAGGATTL